MCDFCRVNVSHQLVSSLILIPSHPISSHLIPANSCESREVSSTMNIYYHIITNKVVNNLSIRMLSDTSCVSLKLARSFHFQVIFSTLRVHDVCVCVVMLIVIIAGCVTL